MRSAAASRARIGRSEPGAAGHYAAEHDVADEGDRRDRAGRRALHLDRVAGRVADRVDALDRIARTPGPTA